MNCSFNRQIFTHLKLSRDTASNERKLFRFDKMEVIGFEIVLIYVTFYR